MSDYLRPDMTGVLFKSKSDNPRAPVMSGVIQIDGREIRVSGWYATDKLGNKKMDKNGNPYLRLKLGNGDSPKPEPKRTEPDELF